MNENLVVIFAKIYHEKENDVKKWLFNFGIDIDEFQKHEIAGVAFGRGPTHYVEDGEIPSDILIIADRKIEENDHRIGQILCQEYVGRRNIFILYHMGTDQNAAARLGSQSHAINRARNDSQCIFPIEEHSNNEKFVIPIMKVGNALSQNNRTDYLSCLDDLQKTIGDKRQKDIREILDACVSPAGAGRVLKMLTGGLLPDYIAQYEDLSLDINGRKSTFKEALSSLERGIPTSQEYNRVYDGIRKLLRT